jgi:hypothetical protein
LIPEAVGETSDAYDAGAATARPRLRPGSSPCVPSVATEITAAPASATTRPEYATTLCKVGSASRSSSSSVPMTMLTSGLQTETADQREHPEAFAQVATNAKRDSPGHAGFLEAPGPRP